MKFEELEPMKQELIDSIVELEWEMFHSVNNRGGMADCQNDNRTFQVMRRSQILLWPENLLESYFGDLFRAKREGRNLMTEKYARMMETTAPMEYAQIKDRLPEISQEKQALIDELAGIFMAWEEDVRKRYPFLEIGGRPLRQKDLSARNFSDTSFEVYNRGEISTFSEKTLRAYLEYAHGLMDQGKNGSELIYQEMVQMEGYASLEEAQKTLGKKG